MGLNKFPANVNYYQMILLVNGGQVSPEWLKLRVLQLHLHANLIKKWLRWMDKAENGGSDNWDVDHHISRNAIPFCFFLLSQEIEPEKIPSPLILMPFTGEKFLKSFIFPQIKMKTTFLLISLLLNLQKRLVKGSSFAFYSFRLRDGGKQGAHDITELWHHTNWHLLKESWWIRQQHYPLRYYVICFDIPFQGSV